MATRDVLSTASTALEGNHKSFSLEPLWSVSLLPYTRMDQILAYIPLFPPLTDTLLPHSTTLGMLLYWLTGLASAAATPLGQSVIAHPRCVNPSIRREWRSMSPQQRAGWIDAVKVGTLNAGSLYLSHR